MIRGALLSTLISASAVPATAEAFSSAPQLTFPVDCVLGESCDIQNYFDRDPGPGMRDAFCGAMGYDGHDGTDVRLPDRRAMEAGVQVLAAAAGRVRGMRDGMPDAGLAPGQTRIADGRDCGNGLVIDHGDGWQTQYCHLKQGSLRVRTGQRVAAGDVVGEIGLSGRTQFPHLHFELRKGDVSIDPFLPEPDAACAEGGNTTDALWKTPLTPRPGGLIGAGFGTTLPEMTALEAGTDGIAQLGRSAPALVLWGYAFGGRAGDVMALRIEGPSGLLMEQSFDLPRNQAQYFRAAGLRRQAESWPRGSYRGQIELMRDGRLIDLRDVVIETD